MFNGQMDIPVNRRWCRTVIAVLAVACVCGALFVVSIAMEDAIQADCTGAMDYGVVHLVPLMVGATIAAICVYSVRWFKRD